jgi:hypothetical protein
MTAHHIIFGIFLIMLFCSLFALFTKLILIELRESEKSDIEPMGTKTTATPEKPDFNTWATFIHSQNRTK